MGEQEIDIGLGVNKRRIRLKYLNQCDEGIRSIKVGQ